MTQKIRFGDWVWDPDTLELRNGPHVTVLEPRVARLLDYLVVHPGELLSHDRIVKDVWEGRVVSDETVRRAVFNLRQALAFDGADSYIRTIRTKGYIAGFPGEPYTHPAIEAAMSSPMAGTPPLAAASASARLPQLLKLAGALALVVAALTRFGSLWEREPATAPTELTTKTPATIAVLPLANLSEDPRNDYLADGLAEELISTLARNRDLRVTARSSAFQFSGRERDVREVGRLLGVRYILEGSVREAGEQVRIQARLVESGSGTQLWAEAYDRGLADWPVVEQDVAIEVGRALDLVLQKEEGGNARPGGTSSVEAHLEVLRARQLLASRSVADTEQAVEHLQRALTLDPNYAQAYARLADAILIQAESTTGVRETRPVVAPLVEKALALDPGLGEAYIVRSMLSDDPAEAERDLRRGLELNPSYARGYELLADLQLSNMPSISREHYEAVLRTIDSAIALDPLTPGNYHAKAAILDAAGIWPEAAVLVRRALELNPQFRAALGLLGGINAKEGDFADAVLNLERAVALDPRAVSLRGQLRSVYLAIGDIESARALDYPFSASGELDFLWAEGRHAEAVDLIYSGTLGPLSQVNPMGLSQTVLTQALSDRDFERALALLSAALPYPDSQLPGAFGWGFYGYVNLVQLLAASGDTSAASRLQAQIEEKMEIFKPCRPCDEFLHNQIRAPLLAHAGRSEEACAALERSYTPVPRIMWRMVVSNPAFDNMRTRPCFQAMVERFEAHTAAERARIVAMRGAGQIPDRTPPAVEDGVSVSP